jgi:hypothetical protein
MGMNRWWPMTGKTMLWWWFQSREVDSDGRVSGKMRWRQGDNRSSFGWSPMVARRHDTDAVLDQIPHKWELCDRLSHLETSASRSLSNGVYLTKIYICSAWAALIFVQFVCVSILVASGMCITTKSYG